MAKKVWTALDYLCRRGSFGDVPRPDPILLDLIDEFFLQVVKLPGI
jgi:hypothetical protein